MEIKKLSLNFMKTEFLLFGNQSQLRNFDDFVGRQSHKKSKFYQILGNNIRRRPEMA